MNEYSIQIIAGKEFIVKNEPIPDVPNTFKGTPVISKDAFLLAYNTWVNSMGVRHIELQGLEEGGDNDK